MNIPSPRRSIRGLRFPLVVGLLALAACETTPADGAGGSGTGDATTSGSAGGAAAFCQESVNSVVAAPGGTTPYIVKADGGYLLAVLEGGEVTVMRLDESVTVLSGTQVSSSSGTARLPSVNATAGGFTALWAQGSDIFMRPLDGDGKPTGPAAMVASVASSEPRPVGASTGAAVAAAWMDGATSSTAGVLSGDQLSQAAQIPGWFPAVATSDGVVGVAWSEAGEGGAVQVALLDATSSPTTVPGSSALIKSLTGIDGDFVVAWEEVGGGAEEIGLARVGIGGSVVAETKVAASLGGANWPAIAWSGERLAVAFYQFRDDIPSVFVTFYDGALSPIENEVLLADDAKYPSVAWGPGGVAVAYASEAGGVEVSLVTCP